jgi:hypothetical protein
MKRCSSMSPNELECAIIESKSALGGAAHPPGLQALLRTRAGAGSVAIIPLGAEHKGWFRNANTPDDLRLSTKLPPGESSPD